MGGGGGVRRRVLADAASEATWDPGLGGVHKASENGHLHHLNWETSVVSENQTWGRLSQSGPLFPLLRRRYPHPGEGGTPMLPSSACGHVPSHGERAVLMPPPDWKFPAPPPSPYEGAASSNAGALRRRPAPRPENGWVRRCQCRGPRGSGLRPAGTLGRPCTSSPS